MMNRVHYILKMRYIKGIGKGKNYRNFPWSVQRRRYGTDNGNGNGNGPNPPPPVMYAVIPLLSIGLYQKMRWWGK